LYVALLDINPDYQNKIDESVYSFDREMRCIYSSKFGDFRILKPIDTQLITAKFCNNYLDYFITHFNEKYELNFINTPEYKNPNLPVLKRIIKISDLKGNHIKNLRQPNSTVPDRDILNRFNELLQFVHPTAFFTNMTRDNVGWRYGYTDRTELCYTGHTHKSNGFVIHIKPNNGNIYIYCYSNKCGKLFKLGNLHFDTKWRQESLKINQQYLEYKTAIKFKNILETENVKFSAIINEFIENGGNYVIRSCMGSGKTQLLVKLVTLKFSTRRILYLSHRQTFTQNIYGTFKKCGFYNYLDGVKDLDKQDRLIVQIDSLRHLLNEDNKLKYFDIIILDEIESLLAHLSSPTLADKRSLICLIIEKLIKNAKWVLSLDADFGNRAYDFLSIIKEKPRIIMNEYIGTKKKFMFNSNYDLRCHKILEDIKRKNNIVIICLSKNTLDEIYKMITDKIKNVQIIRYTSMTDDEQKRLLANVNEEWIKYQVVIYSPTIEAGVDFNQVHFNKIYCFLNSGSCSPRSLLQMVGRIRSLADNNILCCYDKCMKFNDKNTYIPSITEVEDMIVNNDYLINNYEFTNINDEFCKLVVKKDAFTRTFAHNYIENYEKQVNFLSILKEMIIERDYEYINEDAGEKETDNHLTEICKGKESEISGESICENSEPDININEELAISTYKTTKKVEEMDELLDSPIITKKELLILQKNKSLTRTDKLSIKKYWIIDKFKIKPEELTMDFLLNWYEKEYILDNALYVLGKKKINDVNDPLLNNTKKKIDYLKQILIIYGFGDIFDFETIITKDDKVEKRMKDSELLTSKYADLMHCFDKKMRQKQDKFSISQFTRLSESILNDFGIGLKCGSKRIQEDNEKRTIITYKLKETKKLLRKTCDLYK
jgi:hypothetical protein